MIMVGDIGHHRIVAGNRNNHAYLIGYIYPKENKGLFGLGRRKEINWMEIYSTEDIRIIADSFKLYFDRDFTELETKIRVLEKFGEMEAQN